MGIELRRSIQNALLTLGLLAPAFVIHAAPVRFTADGEIGDAAFECENDSLRGWFARKPSNEPFVGEATLQPAEGGTGLILKGTAQPGSYVLSPFACATLVDGVQLILKAGDEADIMPIVKEAEKQEAGKPTHPEEDNHYLWAVAVAAALIGGVGVGFMSGWIMRGGRTAVALALFGFFGVFSASLRVSAHEGHEHAPSPGTDAPTIGGEVKLTKQSQFLIGVRSATVQARKMRDSVIAYGHLHPKPQQDAILTAPQAGFIRVHPDVILGAKIHKGQILGTLDALASISIVSPVDGELIELEAVSGVRVDTGAKLFRVSSTTKLWVDADVFESDLQRLPKGSQQDAVIQVLVDGQREAISGTLMTSRSPLSEETRTAKFFVEVDNADGHLRLGSFASVYFLGAESKEGITIPKGAVLNRGGEQLVIIQTGPESFKARTVLVERGTEPGTMRVLNGLADGDRVVVAGNYQLLAKVK